MLTALKLRWRTAYRFAADSVGWRKKFFLGGLWIMLFPPVGWLLALGYRKEVAFRLVDNRSPVLPDWSLWPAYLRDGLKSAGVILTYYLPYILAFWAFVLAEPSAALEHWRAIAVFALAVPFCLPVFLPVLPPLYCYLFPWIHLQGWQVIALAVLFAATTFIMPAVFMQVSWQRSYKAAFNLKAVFSVIAADLRLYLEGWLLSLSATAIAIALGPLAPWGIFWSYQTISFAFNNVLALSSMPCYRLRFSSARAFHGDS